VGAPLAFRSSRGKTLLSAKWEAAMMQPGQVVSLIGAMDRAAARLATDTVIRDLDDTPREIVAAAVEAVPGATHAGLTVRAPDGRILSTAPTTTELVARLDQAQPRCGRARACWPPNPTSVRTTSRRPTRQETIGRSR
jgi:hypothetical protein